MKRLTKLIDGKWIENHDFDELKGFKNGNLACMNKLAAYEDTDLTPEEVAELAQAKADGRLAVSPCKLGDKVYSLRWDIKSERYKMQSGNVTDVRYCLEDECIMISDGEYIRMYNRDIFLTHEAAQAALDAQKEQSK